MSKLKKSLILESKDSLTGKREDFKTKKEFVEKIRDKFGTTFRIEEGDIKSIFVRYPGYNGCYYETVSGLQGSFECWYVKKKEVCSEVL